MKINVFSIMALLVLLLAFPLHAAQNGVPVSSCGEITESSYLTQDLVAAPKCLFISGSNLVLDCDGHSIIGPNETNTGQGLDVSIGIEGRGLSNVTITGCTIAGVDFGIDLEGVTDMSVDNNTIYNYFIYGIYASSNGQVQLRKRGGIMSFLGASDSVSLESSNPNGAYDMSMYGNVFRDNNVPSAVGISLVGYSANAQVLSNVLGTNAESDIALSGTGVVTVDQNILDVASVFSDEAMALNLGSNLPPSTGGSNLAQELYSVSFSGANAFFAPYWEPIPTEQLTAKANAHGSLKVTSTKTIYGEFVNLSVPLTHMDIVNVNTGNMIKHNGILIGYDNNIKEMWLYVNMTNPQVPKCWAYYRLHDGEPFWRDAITSTIGVRFDKTYTESLTFTCTPEGYVNATDFNSATGQSSSMLIKMHEYEPPVPPE